MHIGMYSNNCHLFTSGGSENHIRDLSRALVRQGNRVTVVTNCSHASKSDRFTEEGVEIIVKKQRRIAQTQSRTFLEETWRKMSPALDYKDMFAVMSQLSCDVYHQHDFSSNYLTTRKLVANGHRTVLTNHLGEYLLMDKYLPRTVMRYILKPYSAIIGPSDELTPAGLHPNVSEIWNGFDQRVFKPQDEVRSRVRKALDIEPNDILVIVPRRWAPTKGVIFAAEAARQLKGENNIKWLFLGRNSPGYTQYKSEVLSCLHGLPNVQLSDSVPPDELNELFNAADICVIPSLMEAVSIAAI